jgi:hypothetical protein
LQNNSEIANSALLSLFNAYSPSFKGGVFVAVGDGNGDGVPDVITGPGAGIGPLVKVIDGTKINLVSGGLISNSALLGQFDAFGPKFTGGVRVDAVDVNGDGLADIIVGAGGGTEIKVVDGSMVGTITGQPGPSAILLDFMLDLSSSLGLPTPPTPLASGLQLPPSPITVLFDSVFSSSIPESPTGLSPDTLTGDLSKIYTDPAPGFPSGRTQRDNVTDTTFQLLTSNDNGSIVTDALDGSLLEFPYLGRPKFPRGGPNP